MQTTRWAIALCALTILPVLGPAAWAQQAAPGGSAGTAPGAKPDAGWTGVVTPGTGDGAQPPPAWSEQDVQEARIRCAGLLKDLDLVAVPADPIREGDGCGSPAPMRLVSIGSSPPVAFSPPPLLTCDMIVALHKWLKNDVQRLARKHLGAPVVGVKVMSAYSCRNAYGRAKGKLSEHGRVNALDFGEFLTARGETTQVVADWGPVAREIVAKAAAARAETVKRQAEAAAAAQTGKVPQEPQVAEPSGKILQGGTIRIGIPGLARPSGSETGYGWAPPSRLGGPKDKEAEVASPAGLNGKATFLRAVHKAACATFSTVLGPEANTAHRNHFHLDMARRTSGSVCE